MYLLCIACNQRSHLSLWKRIGVYTFACPHCGATRVVD